MNMKRTVVAMMGVAAALPTYSLGDPHVTVVRNVTDIGDYARLGLDTWALSNACYAGASAAYFRGSNMGSTLVDIEPNKPAEELEEGGRVEKGDICRTEGIF